MKKVVNYIILSFIGLTLIFVAVACEKSSGEPVQTKKSRPTTEEMNIQYDNAIEEDITRTKEYTFDNFTSEYDEVKKFEKYEATFKISEEFEKADYFNTNIIDIFAYIKTPSGNEERTPAFYYREDGTFGLRYSPREVGTFNMYLKDEISGITSEEIAFSAIDADLDNRGFLAVDKNKMVDSYGEQFTIFGTNYAWGSVAEYNISMPLYKENGINFLRFWGQCPWSPFNLERSPTYENGSIVINEVQNDSIVEYEGLGIYSLMNAERFDALINTFEDNDVYIMYCWRNLWEFTSKHWETNPYNEDNGGMCYWKTNDTNFWTHPLAIKYQKQALRYIVARYGYSTSFAVFEYWNECDNKVTADTPDISATWHQTMDEYLKSIDIYNSPTTTSFAWLDHKDLNGRNPWKDLNFLDIFNGHRYSINEVDPLNVWEVQIEGLNSNTAEGDIKPVFFGEFSEDNAENKGGDQLRDNFFKEGIYDPLFFLNTAGTNLHWRVDNTFLPSEKMFEYIKIASDLITPFEDRLVDMTFETYLLNDLRVGYYYNDSNLMLYLRDEKPEGDNAFYMSTSPRKIVGEKIMVIGLKGTYELKYYSTETGELVHQETVSFTEDETTINLPEFYKDLFITAERGA